MTSLKMAFHPNTGRRMVEIYDDTGRLVGEIYPSDDRTNSVLVVSDHIAGLGEIPRKPATFYIRFDKAG